VTETQPLFRTNKIAVIGNPNVGKSALFNKLTKSYSLVSNAPYTTVSVLRSTIVINGNKYEIIDTPGIISLDVKSEDGLVTRNILIEESPQIVILCMDASNIKRSLILAAQAAELEIPMIACLNFVDESRQRGIIIDRKKLEELLGVPVVETNAFEGRGIKELTRALPGAAVPLQPRISYKPFIENAMDELSECFPPDAVPADALLLLLLLKDHGIEQFITSQYGHKIFDAAAAIVARVHRDTPTEISRLIFEERNMWAETVSKKTTEAGPEPQGRYGQVISSLCRHHVCGWIILLGIIYCTYILVGSIGINILVPFFEQKIFAPVLAGVAELIPWQVLRDFLVGDYGILSTGFANAVGTALPILSMFFIILNILEDTGYIPNLCVLTNRFFQRVGLSGKAILPVILGFGCKTMATLTTKILESKKERFIAIFLIAFAIPCAPLLGMTLAVLALFPFSTFLIVFGVLVMAEITAGIALNKILKTDVSDDFIMEIPPIRLPNIKNLITKTYFRLKWFTVEAIPLFMAGACILFFLEKLHILTLIKKAFLPLLVTVLNLPISTVEVFLLCLLRKEAGAVMFLDLAQNQQLDYIQIIVGVILINCFIPCFANIMAMIKLLGIKTALLMTLVITSFSAIIGVILNAVLRSF